MNYRVYEYYGTGAAFETSNALQEASDGKRPSVKNEICKGRIVPAYRGKPKSNGAQRRGRALTEGRYYVNTG